MSGSFRLGRIAGVHVDVNWTWLVIFALIVWSLSQAVFPDQNPGLSEGAYVTMGVIAALVFFAALLAHELGHAIQARREGMEIDAITLWLLGGVASFRGAFPSARAELRVAIAGPAVTAVLAAAFIVAAAALELPAGVDAVLAWLGYINVLLLVFNLLPALPLDGGRVLRALVWDRGNDVVQATRIAGTVARALAVLFIGGGVFLFIFEGAFSGAWLAFIGWFLLQATEAEVRSTRAGEMLSGLRVRDLMSPDPATVPSGVTLGRFMDEIAWTRRHTTYPVVARDDSVVGLLTFECVAKTPRSEWDEHTVEECMKPKEELPVVHEDEEAIEALDRIRTSGEGRALVLEDGRLVGLLSMSDLGRALEAAPRRPRLAGT